MKTLCKWISSRVFLSTLSLCLLVYCFSSKKQRQPIIQDKFKTIAIDSSLFQKKLKEKPPTWMQEQIKRDLTSYQASGISKEALDHAFQGSKIPNLLLVRFQIKDGHLTFSHDAKTCLEDNLYVPRLKQVTCALQTLCSLTKLPDVDFVLSLEDYLSAGALPGCPCFVFAKQEDITDQVLIPDFEALAGYGKLPAQIAKASQQFSWDHKLSQAFWRGSATGGYFTRATWDTLARSKLVLLSLKHPQIIDAKFHKVTQCDPDIPVLFQTKGMVARSTRLTNHLKYKYLVDVDGNSCSYERCFWILLSNSLLMKQESHNIQWYYHALKPGKHYLPVKADLSDLPEKIAWAQEHDAEARAMAENGAQFAKENLSPEDILLYVYHLLVEYAQLQKF